MAQLFLGCAKICFSGKTYYPAWFVSDQVVLFKIQGWKGNWNEIKQISQRNR
jgi:hypothetical protein